MSFDITFDSYISFLLGGNYQYLYVYIFLFTFLSEDIACVSAGILASMGKITFSNAWMATAFGIFVGDVGLYGLGWLIFNVNVSIFGMGIQNKIQNFKINLHNKFFSHLKIRMEKNGGWLLLFTRFLPGTRLPTYLLSNQIYPGVGRFAGIMLIGSLVWTPILVGGAYFTGKVMFRYMEIYSNFWIGILLIGFIFFALYYFWNKLMNFKNMKIYWGNLKSRFLWEFWSTQALYFPIVIYILYLGIRYRSMSLFTISNPRILASGIVGESKTEILNSIKAKDFVADYFTIGNDLIFEHKMTELKTKLKNFSMEYPIVMKPDIGERGKDVQIIYNNQEAQDYLSKNDNLTIVQKYIGGLEYGIQILRYPDSKDVEIISLCHKVYYTILGNGIDNLENLILNDPRAVCQAKIHLEKFKNDLQRVPVEQEKIVLTQLGTHSRGSMFLDFNSKITKSLIQSVRELVLSIPEFHIGRFDVKSKTEEDFFKRGKFLVLELNGLSGEPAHIYDPQHNIFYAWKNLMRTWKLGFYIGSINRKRGFSPMKIREFYRLIQ